MNITFEDVKGVIEYNQQHKTPGFEFPLLPRLNSIIGNIDKSQVHVISGLPSAGVSSFIDQNYVMSVLLQWYNTPLEERTDLKIFYYSMKDDAIKKLQLLLCNYLKLVDGLRTDIATLNNQKGRLYDISKDTVLLNAIENSSTFFNTVIDDGILEIISGAVKPTDIFNNIMNNVSEDDSNILDNKLIMVIVDPVDYLLPDNDGFGIITGNALHEKFQNYIKALKHKFNITFVLGVPSVIHYIRSPRDTEPHYKHLGTYGNIADKGIIIYNSINEKNTKFYDGEEDAYVTQKGNILMRTWHIVRNKDGIESVYDRMFFLPGTSYMVEYTLNNPVPDIGVVLDKLEEDTHFKE
jgi:hypothetical protein